MTRLTIQSYAQVPPCIDSKGHKFVANLVGVVVCERCGMRSPR